MNKSLTFGILLILFLLTFVFPPVFESTLIPRTPVTHQVQEEGTNLYTVTLTQDIHFSADATRIVTRLLTAMEVAAILSTILVFVKEMLNNFNEIDKLIEGIRTFVWWKSEKMDYLLSE